MSLFENQTTEGVEEAEDRLGGFRVLETGAYTGKIKMAYAGLSSSSKAQSVTIIFEGPNSGEYRETIWVTSGEGKNTYVDKQDKTKLHFLPGWTTIDDICLVTCNKGLAAMTSEDKVVNIYNSETKKEEPKSVPALVELIGKEVTLGITKSTVNKQKKDSNNVYQDTAETRDENSIDKVFHHPSNLTVVEAKKKLQVATFYTAWVERNSGKTRDKTSKVAGQGGTNGRPGKPPQAGDSAPKANSLFN